MTSVELLIISFCVVISLISTRFLPLAIIVSVIFWVFRWIAKGHASVRTPADWPIFILVFMVLISMWVTDVPSKTVIQVLRLMTGIALFYAIVNWAESTQRIRWIVLGITVFGLLLSLFAVVSVEWTASKLPFFPSNIYDRFILLVTDTANPNVMAGTLVILVPVIMAVLLFNWTEHGWPFRVVILFTFLIMTGVLVLTQSRSAWIAYCFASIGLITLRWKRGWVVIPISILVIVSAIGYFERRLLLDTIISSATIGGIEGRIEVWSRAIFMIQDFSYTGVGMGLYGNVADLLYPFYFHGQGIITHAHNLFLQVAVDLGIPGLIAWSAILLIVICVSWKVYSDAKVRRYSNKYAIGLGAGLLCSQIALIAHGLTDAVTWGIVRPAPTVWVVWGLAVSTWLWLVQD